MRINPLRRFVPLVALCAVIFASGAAHAQFMSGSTGTEPLVVDADMVFQLPEDGVLHYTDVVVEQGATLTFLPNADNTPVWILASGTVTINGTIDVSGQEPFASSAYPDLGTIGGAGGPGGFRGGWTTLVGGQCQGGSGPGGGGTGVRPGPVCSGTAGHGASAIIDAPATSSDGINGTACCDPDWLLLGGGSGGGSGEASGVVNGGGGGGGVLYIACDNTITINGTILANGASGGSRGGDGGGGVVRMAASVLDVGATMRIEALSPRGGNGVVQIEMNVILGEPIGDKISPAPRLALAPQVGGPPFPSNERPRLEILSINSQVPTPGPVPIDVAIPAGPGIVVQVQGEYIPVPNEVTVVVRPVGEPEMRFTGMLTGTLENSTANVPVTIPAGQRLGAVQAFISEIPTP